MPTKHLDISDVSQWTVEEVAVWMGKNNFGEAKAAVKQNKINGDRLLKTPLNKVKTRFNLNNEKAKKLRNILDTLQQEYEGPLSDDSINEFEKNGFVEELPLYDMDLSEKIIAKSKTIERSLPPPPVPPIPHMPNKRDSYMNIRQISQTLSAEGDQESITSEYTRSFKTMSPQSPKSFAILSPPSPSTSLSSQPEYESNNPEREFDYEQMERSYDQEVVLDGACDEKYINFEELALADSHSVVQVDKDPKEAIIVQKTKLKPAKPRINAVRQGDNTMLISNSIITNQRANLKKVISPVSEKPKSSHSSQVKSPKVANKRPPNYLSSSNHSSPTNQVDTLFPSKATSQKKALTLDIFKAQPWYKEINREEATNILNSRKQNGDFLIRPSYSDPEKPYTLTLYMQGVKNIPIRSTSEDNFALGKTPKNAEQTFENLSRLVEFYRTKEIEIETDGLRMMMKLI